MKIQRIISVLPIAVSLLAMPAFAQFSPGPNPITGTVTGQTLSSGTGTINSGGAISITTNGVALTLTGTSTLINNGTIQTTGTGRAIDSNSGTANLTLTNTGLISSVSTDAFRVNTNSVVSLTNSGTIRVTAGGQAIDWAAITSASNSLTNQSTGMITAVGEDAVRPGTNGIVINAGTISATPTGTTTPTGSDGIDVRTFTGIQVTNTGTISGRHGIATDGGNVGPSSITVTNNAGGLITAVNGSGINIDGVSTTVTANVTNQSGATIRGGVTAASTDGDGDGIDVDGVLTLNNSGDILGLGAKGGTNNPEGVAAGGGSITNTATGRIIGSSLTADAPNGENTRSGNGILIDNSSGGNAVATTTVNNSGEIRGKSGFGIKIVGTFSDSVTNNSGGLIRGAGTGAAIQTGDGADTVTNSGTITGDTGSAIDLEAGNDTLTITGGSASISGTVNGGTGTDTLNFTPGVGNTFNASSDYINFETVNVNAGTTLLNSALATDLTVKTGGILGGTGSAQDVILESGGTIAPGNSPGTLTIDSLVWNGGSTLKFEIGTVSDKLVILGALTKGTAGMYEFLFTDVGGTIASSYDVLEFTSTNFVASDFTFTSTAPGYAGNFVINDNKVTLQVTAVPEPSSTALFVLGALVLVLHLRNTRRVEV